VSADLANLSGVPEYLWKRILQDLDRYSQEQQAEACGMILSWRSSLSTDTVWSWKLLRNVLERSMARHRFEMDERGVRMVLEDLEGLIEGRVHALIHSHPFTQSHDGDGVGPSAPDLFNRRSAERDARAEGGVLPDSLLWLPRAGSSGVVMGYNGEGETWRLAL
jgi:hypothetical protein